MQNLETEKSKIDYSKMTISQLKYHDVICFKVRTYGH